MKKLIKLMSILCALLMLLSFGLVGCSDGDEESDEPSYKKKATLNNMTAEEVYNDILETIDLNAGNFTSTTDYKIKCKMSMQGQSYTIDVKMTDIFKMDDGYFYEEMYVDAGEMAGQDLGEMTTETWFIDDVAYISSVDTTGAYGTQKAKFSSTWANILAYLGLEEDSWFNPIYDFSDTAFEDVKFFINEEDKNDVYFDIILDGEEASAFANKLLEKQGNSGIVLAIDEIQYRFLLNKDGELDHIEIDFVANASSGGMDIKYTYDGTIKFSNVGTTEVSEPADASDYLDYGPLPSYK